MRLGTLRVLVLIAFRNLRAGRVKTLVAGGIIALASLLVVVGSSLLGSVNEAMARSIIGSAAGHLQVYSASSKDELAIFGGMTGDPDLRPMEDFSRVKRTLLAVPNVERVVPQGIFQAMASSGNELDIALEKLRACVNRRRSGEQVAPDEYAALKDHVRQAIGLLQQDARNSNALTEERAIDPSAALDLGRAVSDAFWDRFEDDPLAALEFLENRIAPQSIDGDFLFVRYIGTDLDAYRRAFDRFQIVEGTPVPRGRRGVLFGKLYYESFLKLKIAYRLDKIRDARKLEQREIARDEELARFVKENVSQTREIVIQLDSLKRAAMISKLRQALGSDETDVSKLLATFLATDDRNFDERYRFFYEEIAPLVRLYQVRPGDTITVKSFTRSGYVRSVNLKLYGVFQLRGIEKSEAAGLLALMDMMSFRDLYGFLTADERAEIARLQRGSGARAIARDRVEAELFAGDEPLVTQARVRTAPRVDEAPRRSPRSSAAEARVYTQDEIDRGVAINAAVILKDPALLDETTASIEQALRKEGLDVKVVSWKKAAGLLGQLVTVLRIVLVTVAFVIFLVALVIINNATIVGTLQRVKEIGALRAIGAQRRFVLWMIGVETVVVGLVFGALGSALGAAVILWLRRVGLPAASDQLQFIFAGPRLHPSLALGHFIAAFAAVLAVSLLSSLYPALVATHITPLEAMQSED